MARGNASTAGRCIALGLVAVILLAVGTVPARADDAGLPTSLADAVRMERENALPRTSFYDTPALAGTKPGDLLRREDAAGYAVPAGTSAVRILYHSQDADGRDVATSGVVLVPPGAPPAGGWPVIAWAHGTTGVARQCAPSLEKDLAYGEEGLMPMVRAGFAIVATDYHGLGTEGPHQYLNKLAQGRDVINAVPAAREAVPSLGRKWVVDGHSQGGRAAWSVAELEAGLDDPDYLGAVSVAGASDYREAMVETHRPGDAGAYLNPYVAYAIRALTPAFDPADLLQGVALARYAAVTSEGCWDYAYAAVLEEKPGSPLKPGWDRNPAVERFLQGTSLGDVPIRGPLLVIAGESDRTVPVTAIRTVVRKACGNGIALTLRVYPGLDHDPVMDKSTPDQLAWISDRFANKPVANGCGEVP